MWLYFCDSWVVVSNIFYFHPYLRKIPILTNFFRRGWFNHQLVSVMHPVSNEVVAYGSFYSNLGNHLADLANFSTFWSFEFHVCFGFTWSTEKVFFWGNGLLIKCWWEGHFITSWACQHAIKMSKKSKVCSFHSTCRSGSAWRRDGRLWHSVCSLLPFVLEGCGPATATDYDATTTTALVFAIVFLVPWFCVCCWWTACLLDAVVNKIPICSVDQWCFWMVGAVCVGLPFLVVIWPWIARGIYVSGRNCETLQAMQPDFCEAWQSPARVGFTEKLCCDPPSTTTTSTMTGCEGMRLSNLSSSSCESLGLAWVIPYPTGDTLEECCVMTMTWHLFKTPPTSRRC